MDVKAMIMGRIDRCCGRPVLDAGQPPGIAVGQYINRFPLLLLTDLFNQGPTVLPYFSAIFHLLFSDGAGGFPGSLHFLFRIGLIVNDGYHLINSPAQIDGGGAGRFNAVCLLGQIGLIDISVRRV